MKIKKIVIQRRRDFTAVYECEHCGHTKQGDGYDDNNFHKEVIPKMKRLKCGRVAPEEYRPLSTRYPDGMDV
jgi:ribosomal protein L37AE/L43A